MLNINVTDKRTFGVGTELKVFNQECLRLKKNGNATCTFMLWSYVTSHLACKL